MVFEFRFFNQNNKNKKNMDNLENNLLHVSHTLCIIISYFLRYNLHFVYSLPGHYYKSCCFHIESESCIFVMYRFNAEHPGQSLYTPTTVGVIYTCTYTTSCVGAFRRFESSGNGTRTRTVLRRGQSTPYCGTIYPGGVVCVEHCTLREGEGVMVH